MSLSGKHSLTMPCTKWQRARTALGASPTGFGVVAVSVAELQPLLDHRSVRVHEYMWPSLGTSAARKHVVVLKDLYLKPTSALLLTSSHRSFCMKHFDHSMAGL